MKRRLQSPTDIQWLFRYTHAFKGAKVLELVVRKERMWDEWSGETIPASTTLVLSICFEHISRSEAGPCSLQRLARLTMEGVSDFSIFEQDGSDFSDIRMFHAEIFGERLRFWFDPYGELYAICEQAVFEEVSRPAHEDARARGVREWSFQSQEGHMPQQDWFLEALDRVGLPCAWRNERSSGNPDSMLRWEGELIPATPPEGPPSCGLVVQAYQPVGDESFGITVKVPESPDQAILRLLTALTDTILRTFAGTCLVDNRMLQRQEWLGKREEGNLGPFTSDPRL